MQEPGQIRVALFPERVPIGVQGLATAGLGPGLGGRVRGLRGQVLRALRGRGGSGCRPLLSNHTRANLWGPLQPSPQPGAYLSLRLLGLRELSVWAQGVGEPVQGPLLLLLFPQPLGQVLLPLGTLPPDAPQLP